MLDSRLLPALLLIACAGADGAAPQPIGDPCSPIVLVAAAGVSDEQRAAIASAAAMWSEVAGTRLSIDAVDGAPVLGVRFASAPLAFFGAYEPSRGDIVVNSDIPTAGVRAITMAHELGHAMGLVHVSGRASVMNPGNTTIAPNSADAIALAALWGTCPR